MMPFDILADNTTSSIARAATGDSTFKTTADAAVALEETDNYDAMPEKTVDVDATLQKTRNDDTNANYVTPAKRQRLDERHH